MRESLTKPSEWKESSIESSPATSLLFTAYDVVLKYLLLIHKLKSLPLEWVPLVGHQWPEDLSRGELAKNLAWKWVSTKPLATQWDPGVMPQSSSSSLNSWSRIILRIGSLAWRGHLPFHVNRLAGHMFPCIHVIIQHDSLFFYPVCVCVWYPSPSPRYFNFKKIDKVIIKKIYSLKIRTLKSEFRFFLNTQLNLINIFLNNLKRKFILTNAWNNSNKYLLLLNEKYFWS